MRAAHFDARQDAVDLHDVRRIVVGSERMMGIRGACHEGNDAEEGILQVLNFVHLFGVSGTI